MNIHASNSHASNLNPYPANPSNFNFYSPYDAYTPSSHVPLLGYRQTSPYQPSPAPDGYLYASEVVILEPQVFSDIPSAVHSLRRNQLVVLNLAKMTYEEAQRSVDFIAGGAYMCQGSLEKIDVNIFLLTPQETNIRVEASQYQSESTTAQKLPLPNSVPDVTITPPSYFLTPRAS
jgi:hypothetical protein